MMMFTPETISLMLSGLGGWMAGSGLWRRNAELTIFGVVIAALSIMLRGMLP